MAKKKPTAGVNVLLPVKTYRDEIQKRVYFYFVNGYDVFDIADKLKLPNDEAKSRVKELDRECALYMEYMTDDVYVRRERALLVMRSKQRRDSMVSYVETVENRISAKQPGVVYPDKTVAQIREEDKWLDKLIDKVEKANKGDDESNPSDPSKDNREEAKSHRNKLMVTVTHDSSSNKSKSEDDEDDEEEDDDNEVSDSLLDDLKVAVADETLT